jgi:hypothetical protein
MSVCERERSDRACAQRNLKSAFGSNPTGRPIYDQANARLQQRKARKANAVAAFQARVNSILAEMQPARDQQRDSLLNWAATVPIEFRQIEDSLRYAYWDDETRINNLRHRYTNYESILRQYERRPEVHSLERMREEATARIGNPPLWLSVEEQFALSVKVGEVFSYDAYWCIKDRVNAAIREWIERVTPPEAQAREKEEQRDAVLWNAHVSATTSALHDPCNYRLMGGHNRPLCHMAV